MDYFTAFSTQAKPMSLVITGTGAGTYSAPIVGSHTWAHIEIGDLSSFGFPQYVDIFQSAFVGLQAAGFSLTFNQADLTYTLSRVSGVFAVNFTGSEEGLNAMAALGFDSDLSGASSYTSTVRPYYVIHPEVEARSGDSDVYEPDDLTQEAVSDGGMAYPVSKDSNEIWRDWTQPIESNTATLARQAVSTVPWTWQHFFKHLREGGYPFLVTDEDKIYFLRAEGASFSNSTRIRQQTDWQSLWNINLRTRELSDYVLP